MVAAQACQSKLTVRNQRVVGLAHDKGVNLPNERGLFFDGCYILWLGKEPAHLQAIGKLIRVLV